MCSINFSNLFFPDIPSIGYISYPGENLQACTANGVDFPLGLPFSFTENCFKYNCRCDTDGSWNCSAELAEYICHENGESQETSEEFTDFESKNICYASNI